VATSAVRRVFDTTELVEMILLDDGLRMDQLFVLQRVNKRLQNVIAGSQKLQFKMFGILACTSQNSNSSYKEEIQHCETEDLGPALFNPLMRISRNDTRMQLPKFRHFDFKLTWEEDGEQTQLCLRSTNPLAGAVEKKLRPSLGGTWREMAISRLPLMLRFQVDGHYLQSLTLQDDEAVTGRLVDILSTWYSDKRQRRRHRYKTVPALSRRRGLTLLANVRID
jgi:hypothetical protein